MPLVRYNGERIWQRLPDGVELDDLISAGVFGLMDAIEAFDLTRGVKFETYCVPRIRGAMLDELRTMDWVPRLVRSKASKLQEATKELETRLGRGFHGAVELSAGEWRRLLLARALARPAEVLVLDEPFAFLDLGSQNRLNDVVTGFDGMRIGS